MFLANSTPMRHRQEKKIRKNERILVMPAIKIMVTNAVDGRTALKLTITKVIVIATNVRSAIFFISYSTTVIVPNIPICRWFPIPQ